MMIDMDELQLVEHEPAVTPATRLFEFGASWREAAEVAEAYRIRVLRAVVEEVDAGMSAPEAARLTGISRVTVNSWRRARRLNHEGPAGPEGGT